MPELSIIYNMFSSKQKQQPKQSSPQLDKNLNRLQLLAASCLAKSNLNSYYAQIWQSLNGKQAKFHPRYQKQISRIKKSETVWNYSDISIVRNCINKSMLNETLSVLADKWCECMQIYLLEPMLEPAGNRPRKNSKQEEIKIIQAQILVFCKFIFSFGFDMYFIFFQKHYQRRTKLQNQHPLTKVQIYQRQCIVFEDFIRNILTTLPSFSTLYHLYFTVILNDSFYGCETARISSDFNDFLKKQLKISEKYEKVYKETVKSLWDFHTQTSLTQKIIKSTQIIPSIEIDHKNYFEKQKMKPVFKQQTITTQLLRFLFGVYCPQAIVSIRYIQMMICYRQNQENFKDLIEQFCFVWIDEDSHAKYLVIADCFEQN